MSKTYVILNEQHALLPEQADIIKSKFVNDPSDTCEIFGVPAAGWTLEQQGGDVFPQLMTATNVVFASPVPVLIAMMSRMVGIDDVFIQFAEDCDMSPNVYIFHNDRREKKEFQNGKIVSVVADTGWELVRV